MKIQLLIITIIISIISVIGNGNFIKCFYVTIMYCISAKQSSDQKIITTTTTAPRIIRTKEKYKKYIYLLSILLLYYK